MQRYKSSGSMYNKGRQGGRGRSGRGHHNSLGRGEHRQQHQLQQGSLFKDSMMADPWLHLTEPLVQHRLIHPSQHTSFAPTPVVAAASSSAPLDGSLEIYRQQRLAEMLGEPCVDNGSAESAFDRPEDGDDGFA